MKQKTGRKLLGVLLTLAMVVGLMPGMGLTAYAEYVCPFCGSTNIDYDEELEDWLCNNCYMPFSTPAESDGSQSNGVCPHCGSTEYEKGEDDDYYSCSSCGDWFAAPVEEVADDSSRIGSVYHTGDTLPKAFYYDGADDVAAFLKQELAIYGLSGCVVDVDDVNALIFPYRIHCYLYFRPSETARGTDAVTAVKISSGGGSRENPYHLTPQYPVSFNANGGSPAPSAQQVWRGDKVTAPAAPTREGCEFAGWFNGNTQWDFNQNSVDYPITLTAHWNVPVTSVSLPDTATLTVDGEAVALTATVEPAEATDKTVKWSTTGGVTLYSDENCTAGNEIGADATSTLIVYAKGISAGSATVTATSNADSTKTASCAVTVNETQQQSGGTDVLTRDDTGRTGTSYGEWSGVTKSSGAVYAGQSAGDHESIQLRSNNNNSGIVTTTSGGKATKVRVVWNSNTKNGRTLNVYGKNSAYSAASDLYGGDQGDLLGTIVCGQSTELTISGDYTYIGMRSNNSAMYLDSITIEWGGSTPVPVAVTGVTLNPSAAQTIEVNGKVSFTATVAPNNATDKTVKWSVGGTDAGAVKLYTNEACTTEVGTAATSTLTVYAKGISAGSATITATSNADSTKSASCAVTAEVSKTALNDAIDEAETYYNSIKDSNPAASAALLEAVNAAKSVKDNADATQEQVDAAIEAINGAKTTAEAAVLTETKTALNNAITEAETYYESIKDSNPAVAATLKDAIDAAKAVKGNADATQAQVDAAITAINAAKSTAAETVLSDTKTNLSNAIDEAETYYNSIKDSNPAAAAALLEAVNAAKSVKDNADATQEQVDAAIEAINGAKTTAEAAVLTETKTALNNAITEAETYYEIIKDSNPAVAATLKDAIDAAKAVKGNADATQTEVDNALTALNGAKTTAEETALQQTISQVMSEVSAKTGSGMTYTGNPIQLINTPTTALPEGYTMKYAVTTENTAPADNLYTTSIPTATDAGTYYVWYKVAGDANHNDSEPLSVSVTIGTRSFTVTFDANGGSGEMEPLTVTEGQALILPECGFTAPAAMTFDAWIQGAPGTKLTVTGDTLVRAKWKVLTQSLKTETAALDAVPDALAEEYQTVDDLKQDMLAQLTIEGSPAEQENAIFYDVTLLISTDGGVTWVPATEENYPADGIPVTLPYPAGTSASTHHFAVAHMFAEGSKAGEIEYPQLTHTAEGIQVTLNGLSPVLLAWAARPAAPSVTPVPAATPIPSPVPAPAPAEVYNIPQTGDTADLALWAGALLLGAAGLVLLKKRKQN